MLEQIIMQFGYAGLVLISFLSATLLPFSSEVVVALMPPLGYNSWLILLFATIGNSLGALANYYVGNKGGQFLLTRYIHIAPETLQRAKAIYERWGTPILFFSWVPIIGDPLTVVPGILNANVFVFTCWVVLGKAVRYGFVLGLSQWLWGP